MGKRKRRNKKSGGKRSASLSASGLRCAGFLVGREEKVQERIRKGRKREREREIGEKD